ncbi:hypothetical protein IV203_012311 [Nitzschia inconspicua]|uniref:Uncharacterized protein n=1 Tax=Nitzschia inconspicua TaxID=303405 RepID=A0A9K3KTH7_9STRA|nr:hypothetical protein IV203_012311 [Nitzschia inconspicua]
MGCVLLPSQVSPFLYPCELRSSLSRHVSSLPFTVKSHTQLHMVVEAEGDPEPENISKTHQQIPCLSSSDSEGPYDRALHEAEHRAKEKFYTVLMGKITEHFHELAERGPIRKRLYAKLERGWSQLLKLRRNVQNMKLVAPKSTLGTTGERIMEKRLVERAVEQTTKASSSLPRFVERAVEQTTKSASSVPTKRVFGRIFRRRQQHRTAEMAIGYSESGVEHFALRVAERGSERASVRFAKGLTISLPVVGGIFAAYLFHQDVERIRTETSADGKRRSTLAFFLGAAVADLMDVFLHFFIAAGLTLQLRRHTLAMAEEWSIGFAAVSTVCAVCGEILSSRITRRNRQLDPKLGT